MKRFLAGALCAGILLVLFACTPEKKQPDVTVEEFAALYQSAMEKSVYFSPYAFFAGIGDDAPEAIEKAQNAVPGYAAVWTVEKDRKTEISTRENMLAWLEETFTHEAAEALLASEAEPGIPWIKEEGGLLYRLIKNETKTAPQIGKTDVSVLSRNGSEGEIEATLHALTSFSDDAFSLALRCRVSCTEDGWRISGEYEEPTSRFVREWEKRSVYQPVGISKNEFMLLLDEAWTLIDRNNEIRVKRTRPSSVDPALADLPEEKNIGGYAYRLCYDAPTKEAMTARLRKCFSEDLALAYLQEKRDGAPLFEEIEGILYVLAEEKTAPVPALAYYYERMEDAEDRTVFRIHVKEREREGFAGYVEVEGKKLDGAWVFTEYTDAAYCLAHPETLSPSRLTGVENEKNR
ncbi:MAG: hypothetical protein IJR89_02870 [Clostridia bacterium]|nr:hypothetical protein [Clostridia bacterium]